jgi:hypothetical protein
VGSRSNKKEIDLAYIAGFLDGDGSLMLQIKKRADGKNKIRFMATICFYQDTRHKQDLSWIRKIFGIGYLSDRNDGMSELRINGFKQVREILLNLIPYIKFKKVQAKSLIQACGILSETKFNKLNQNQLVKLVKLVLEIQNENYVTKKKRTREELFEILGLTP